MYTLSFGRVNPTLDDWQVIVKMETERRNRVKGLIGSSVKAQQQQQFLQGKTITGL